MASTRWPRWSEDLVKARFPDTSLLAGTEPAVWDALGRLAPGDFDAGKQVVLRRALEAVGVGWVATNTTPFRIVVGQLFDAAERRHRAASTSPGGAGRGRKAGTRPSIEIDTRLLPEPADAIRGPLGRRAATPADREALWDRLDSHGACVIRGAVAASALEPLPGTAEGRETKLARTMGNGVAGEPPSVYRTITEPPAWHDELEAALGDLLIGPGAPGSLAEAHARLERRSIVLLAGAGAENWAHQDANDETPPVQAVLMLSEPGRDFSGGEFYVARQTRRTKARIDLVRYEVPFAAAGDLVVFQAGRDSGWWHGMGPVRAGERRTSGHPRVAVGMLQPAS